MLPEIDGCSPIEGAAVTASTIQRRDYLRSRILKQHLDTVLLKHPKSGAETVTGLIYEDAIQRVTAATDGRNLKADNTKTTSDEFLPGGISPTDLERYGHGPLHLGAHIRRYLSEELKDTLCQICASVDIRGKTQLAGRTIEDASNLSRQLQTQQVRLESLMSSVSSSRERIQILVQRTNEIHPRLNTLLIEAINSLPPLLNTQRSASVAELSIKIETCLLKLSLLRAHAHTSLYQQAARDDQSVTMENALRAMQKRLQHRQEEQVAEEKRLDQRIQEYDQLLRMVDRTKGGFSQIVEDMARVHRETGECRRDLRRLGWTGD